MKAFTIQAQPDDVTCGPTCLQGVYRYYGDTSSLHTVIQEVQALEDGGTLAVYLGSHALKRGYRATIYTYNLQLFDPSWFSAPRIDLSSKLREQLRYKSGKKFSRATQAYLEFLRLGGVISYRELSARLLHYYLDRRIPILTGLSATFLYGCKRERDTDNRRSVFDDVRGKPVGHFVVLTDYDRQRRMVRAADPYADNPYRRNRYYWVRITRLINAIMLGILTYDANLLVIQPTKEGYGKADRRDKPR